jgi:uncharacterized membrane protein
MTAGKILKEIQSYGGVVLKTSLDEAGADAAGRSAALDSR